MFFDIFALFFLIIFCCYFFKIPFWENSIDSSTKHSIKTKCAFFVCFFFSLHLKNKVLFNVLQRAEKFFDGRNTIKKVSLRFLFFFSRQVEVDDN